MNNDVIYLALSALTIRRLDFFLILPLENMNFVFPGPIIGVVVGLVIFGLGVTKGIRTARAVTAAPK